jgi:hypothetical protein
MVTYGTDCSDYDWTRGPMDVAAMARDGIQFLTHKATEGTKTRHVHYGEALNRARAAGIPFMGAYMVPRTPGNGGHGSVQAQVDYLLAYLDAQTPWWRGTPEFFLQVDTEHWGYDDVAPRYGVQACDLLRAQTGKWVVHYAPRWAYQDSIGGDHPLWASSYGSNPAVPYRQAYPGDKAAGWAPYSGRTPVFLQYGSKLTIGRQPGCDANAFRGTPDQLRTLITGGDMATDLNLDQTVWTDATAGKKTLKDVLVDVHRILLDGVTEGGPATDSYVLRQLSSILDAAKGATATPATQTTQAQVDAAVLKALSDPAVIAALGAAVASHIKVS